MLVSIALTAATVYTAPACTKRLDKMQWLETWDDLLGQDRETLLRDRDASVRDETETLRILSEMRPRSLDWDHIPASETNWH